MSKDLDVSLWLDYRKFNGDPPLHDCINFVIINQQLHDEFDKFKCTEVRPSYSFIPLSELLAFYCLLNCVNLLKSSIVEKFGNMYLELNSSQNDTLTNWVNETRKRYKTEEKSIFTESILQDMLSNQGS